MSGDWKQQPIWIKTLRWLRYKPCYAGIAAWAAVVWMITGCKPVFGGRWSTFKSIWSSNVKSLAEYDMGNTVSTQEWIDELRLRSRISVTPTCGTLTNAILVAFHETPTILYEEPHQFDRYEHGLVEAGSFDLTVDQAEWLAAELLKAVKASRKFEKDCRHV